jgi:hypothetical protein
MQHLEGSGTPVLYIGRTVLKGSRPNYVLAAKYLINKNYDVLILVKSLIKLCKSKGKAFPLQAWTGPEGSRRMRLPDFKTIGT